MSNLKPTTRALIKIAKERRKGLKNFSRAWKGTSGSDLSSVRKQQAQSIRENRKKHGRAGNLKLLARGYGNPTLAKKYGS